MESDIALTKCRKRFFICLFFLIYAKKLLFLIFPFSASPHHFLSPILLTKFPILLILFSLGTRAFNATRRHVDPVSNTATCPILIGQLVLQDQRSPTFAFPLAARAGTSLGPSPGRHLRWVARRDRLIL